MVSDIPFLVVARLKNERGFAVDRWGVVFPAMLMS